MAQQISGEEHKTQLSQKGRQHKIPSKLIPLVVFAVLLIGLGFAGGVQFQKGKTSATVASAGTSNLSNPSANGFQGGAGGRGGLRGGFGQVTAVDSSSISLNNSLTGSSTTYKITSDTKITDNGQASQISNIKVGDNVLVRTNSSDVKQADQIILNPPSPGSGRSGRSAPSQTQTTDPEVMTN